MNIASANNAVYPQGGQGVQGQPAVFNPGNIASTRPGSSMNIQQPGPHTQTQGHLTQGQQQVQGQSQQQQQQQQQFASMGMKLHNSNVNNNSFSQTGRAPQHAESPIPKQWWDQDSSSNAHNKPIYRSQTPTLSSGPNSGNNTQLNSSYSSYYTSTNNRPLQPNQNQAMMKSNSVPRPYPNTYPVRAAGSGPSSHLVQSQQPLQNQAANQTQPPFNHSHPHYNMHHSNSHMPYPPHPVPVANNAASSNNAASNYQRRDSSLPPTNRSSSIPPPHTRDGSLPPSLNRREGSLPPSLQNHAVVAAAAALQNNNQSNDPTPKEPTSTGLIRITLRKPMGIVFEPIPPETPTGHHHNSQPQKGVRICDLPRTGAAALSRKLQIGDELLSINDKTMSRLTFDEIMDFIIEADPERVNLLFRRPRKEEMTNYSSHHHGRAKSGGAAVGGNGGIVQSSSNIQNQKVKWIDEKSDASTNDYPKASKSNHHKPKTKEKTHISKKKSRQREKNPDSLLDILIDSICSPLVQGESPQCVSNRDRYYHSSRKKRREEDDTDSEEDENTYVSHDSSTYLTYDSSLQEKKHSRNKRNQNKKRVEEDEEDEFTVEEDGSTLETTEDRAIRRKKFQEKRFGVQENVNAALGLGNTTNGKTDEKGSGHNDDKHSRPYEDDATLETVETYERTKNMEDSSYIPQRPLGLSDDSNVPKSQSTGIGHRHSEDTSALDENDKKNRSSQNMNKINSGSSNLPLPIEELEYNDQMDGVSVMTPSLLDFSNAQGGRGDYSLPSGMGTVPMDESIQKSPTKFYHHVVKHLLETHEPEKVRLLDKLLAKYENREEHLIQKLTVRYNRNNNNGNKAESENNPPTIDEEEPYSDKDESQDQSVFNKDSGAGGWPTLSETKSNVSAGSALKGQEIDNESEDRNSNTDDDDDEFERMRQLSKSLSRSRSEDDEEEPGRIKSKRSGSEVSFDPKLAPNKSYESNHSTPSKYSHTSRSTSNSNGYGSQPEGEDDSQSYYSDDYSGSSIDGTSPAIIAQVSELLNFVYGKTSVTGQIDRVSTIMRAYEGRESVLLELLETKALIKANTQNEQQQREAEETDQPTDQGVNGPSIAVDGDGARDDISSVSNGSLSRGTKKDFHGVDQMELIESKMEVSNIVCIQGT